MNTALTIKQQPGIIESNFEEVKNSLDKYLEEYRVTVYTDDMKKIAKETVAGLRKEKKAAMEQLKKKKDEYMEPWNRFEPLAREVIDMYDGPVSLINAQLEEIEEKRRAEKRKKIRCIYERYTGEVQEYITLKKIYNPKWENATFRENDIAKDIYDMATSVKNAIASIKTMHSDAEEQAITIYKNSLNLPDAISFINGYEKQKAEILVKERERQLHDEQERIRREEREKIEAEIRFREEKEAVLKRAEEEKQDAVKEARENAAKDTIDSLIPDLCGESALYEYRMSLTVDAKEKLEMYLDSVGIEWETIK